MVSQVYELAGATIPTLRLLMRWGVTVYTDAQTDPFTLCSTAADDDYIYVSCHYGEHLANTSFLVTEVYLQQLGDRMVFVLDEDNFIIQLLPDTKIKIYIYK